MNSSNVLLLPGWQNSGPHHWQSLWELEYGYTRVDQHDWMRPRRGDWIARLEEVLLGQTGPAVLVAHSLGCQLVAAWAAHSRNTHRVKAALLVAPPDVEREEMRPIFPTWSPIPRQPLPFRALVLSSRNDPYCGAERAQVMAETWGAEFKSYGQFGHINADSGLGLWREGHSMLQDLQQTPLKKED
ncbi:MAG: hypothetical protein RIS34_1203 [Pseudomonadota bacterium]